MFYPPVSTCDYFKSGAATSDTRRFRQTLIRTPYLRQAANSISLDPHHEASSLSNYIQQSVYRYKNLDVLTLYRPLFLFETFKFWFWRCLHAPYFPEKRISNTPSFVFQHLCTKFAKWAQNDIFAAKTMENPASDDTNVKLFWYVAEVLILVLTSVVLIKRTAATSNITDVLASDFVPTPLCLT